MGCDIHIMVEKKNVDGTWQTVKGYRDLYKEDQYQNWIYDSRNYNLFTILANVRADDDFPVISDPKGMPEDASEEYKQYSDDWGVDGHSHSYLTLKELTDYDWQQSARQYGIVSEEQYRKLMKGELPDSWCSAISGPGIKTIDEVTMRDVIRFQWKRSLEGLDDLRLYCSASWSVTCANAANEFVNESIPKLKELANGDLESVRIVFFFDN